MSCTEYSTGTLRPVLSQIQRSSGRPLHASVARRWQGRAREPGSSEQGGEKLRRRSTGEQGGDRRVGRRGALPPRFARTRVERERARERGEVVALAAVNTMLWGEADERGRP